MKKFARYLTMLALAVLSPLATLLMFLSMPFIVAWRERSFTGRFPEAMARCTGAAICVASMVWVGWDLLLGLLRLVGLR